MEKAISLIPKSSELFAALDRVNSPGYKPPKSDYWEDEEGRSCISMKAINARADDEALVRHGNSPLVRFNEWGFPFDGNERKFIFEHDFQGAVDRAINDLRHKKWVYLWGGAGLAKTSLAARVFWEILKKLPSDKATFLSASKFIREKLRREKIIEAAIRNRESLDYDTGAAPLQTYVILDEFDKWNMKNEFNAEAMRDLIDRLKESDSQGMPRHYVIITAQYSLDHLCDLAKSAEASTMLDRVRGKCSVWPEFKGASKR